jgi:PKD repeat protein
MRLLKTLAVIAAFVLLAAPAAARIKVGDVLDARIETPHPLGASYWRQELEFPGATHLRLHLLQLEIGPEDRLLLLDGEGREVYALTGPLAEPLWLPAVDGERAALELWPANGSRPWGFLVDQVVRGNLPITEEGAPVPESICGVNDMKDAICYQSDAGKWTAGDAVGRMYFVSGGGGYLCTGFLVSPNGHFLTNNHCVATESEAQTLEVRWRYQTPQCGSGSPTTHSTSLGAHVVTTSEDYDYSLLTFTAANPAPTYGFLELLNQEATVGDLIWIAQHPGGQPKHFSVVSDMDGGGTPKVQLVNVDGFSTQPPGTDIGYYADTEGGSSGSPVLTTANKVIAIHHAGTGGSACTSTWMNQGVRMTLIYPEIAQYLGGQLVAAATGGPLSGNTPLTVVFNASASGGTGPYTYDWDFGDGSAHSTAQSPTHLYTSEGTYTVTLTVHDSAGHTATDGHLVVHASEVPVPMVTGVTKVTDPFRLNVAGTLFQSGAEVRINGVTAPTTTYKSSEKLVAKKGDALKAMCPKGVTVYVTVENPDGGMSAAFPYTR